MDIRNMSVDDIRLFFKDFKICHGNGNISRNLVQTSIERINGKVCNSKYFKLPENIKQEMYKVGNNIILIYTFRNVAYGEIVKVGVATCHNEDEFDLITGVRIAGQRALIQIEQEKLNRWL